MAAVDFITSPPTPAERPNQSISQALASRALRITRLSGLILAAGVALCAYLRTIPFDGEGFQYAPAPVWLRITLGVVWLSASAWALARVITDGQAPGPMMVVCGILTVAVCRYSHPSWSSWVLAAITGLAFTAVRRAQQAMQNELPLPVRRALGAALWLAGFGLCCMSAGDTPGTVRQLSALLVGSVCLLPLPVALMSKLVSALDRVIKKGWKAENVLWLVTIGLLSLNVIEKLLRHSSVPQITLAGFSFELFEVARGLAVAAFALAGHRWARGADSGHWLPPVRVMVGPAITIVLYLLLREKGTLALLVAGFALTWATQVGGRSTVFMWVTGGLVFCLVLLVAHERLAMATGQIRNAQAEAAMIINTHPGLIGATGAARPTAFLGPAASADFMLSVVASQAGIAGLLLVLTATFTLFAGLFRALWHLPVGAPRALGITAFSHLLLLALSSMVGFSLGLISGLPFPFLARGGNHLLMALFLIGLLLAIGAVNGQRNVRKQREGVVRLRMVMTLLVLGLAAVSLLVIARGRAKWGRPLTDEERAELLSAPATIPYFHGPLFSADGVALAKTRVTAGTNQSRRVYDADAGLAPLIGAGTEHVQDAGIQSRLFWRINQSRGGDNEWLTGPGELTIAPEAATLTIRADWSGQVASLAREFHLNGAALVVRRDGAVVVAVSTPGYDLNRSGDPQYFRAIAADPRKPLLNRAFRGLYPVASTAKPPEANLLVDHGLADSEVMCDGSKCSGVAHGLVRNVEQALQVSCNTWFQQRMRLIAQAEWKSKMEAAGFGPIDVSGAGVCGIPLPSGDRGVPANEAIGQGWVSTPINLAAVYLTILNEGRPVRPFLIDRIAGQAIRPPAPVGPIFSAAARARVLSGMHDVAVRGTARTIFQTYRGNGGSLLGAKTGTAETGDGRTHAILVAVTRDYVVVVVNEYGGKGASLGPLVGRILNTLEAK